MTKIFLAHGYPPQSLGRFSLAFNAPVRVVSLPVTCKRPAQDPIAAIRAVFAGRLPVCHPLRVFH
jgi:hypothetical protein